MEKTREGNSSFSCKQILKFMSRMEARGRIVVRRRPRDGRNGLTIRINTWQPNINYHNDSDIDSGERYLDYVTNKPIGLISDTDFKLYMCRVTHVSNETTKPLKEGTLWREMQNMNPFVTSLLLAGKIKANLIDVDDLFAQHIEANDMVLNEGCVLNGRMQMPFKDMYDTCYLAYSSNGVEKYQLLKSSSSNIILTPGDYSTNVHLQLIGLSDYNGWVLNIYVNPRISKDDGPVYISSPQSIVLLDSSKINSSGFYDYETVSELDVSKGGFFKFTCINNQWKCFYRSVK